MNKFIALTALVCLLPITTASAQNTDSLGTPADSTEWVTPDKQADFPGGWQKMFEYLARNLNYPPQAREAGAEGIAYVQFIVETDGSLSDVIIVQGSGHSSLDEAAVDVMKGMPKWKPAMKDDVPVRSKFVMPVHFQLAKDEPKPERKKRSRK